MPMTGMIQELRRVRVEGCVCDDDADVCDSSADDCNNIYYDNDHDFACNDDYYVLLCKNIMSIIGLQS